MCSVYLFDLTKQAQHLLMNIFWTRKDIKYMSTEDCYDDCHVCGNLFKEINNKKPGIKDEATI